ncbi:MAG: metal ABC transporter permease [Nitrospirae bacterium CG_4_9_14_3_um_filter_53_35]|nr:MAG: metal ABC transporter permease [Nitrospirae bacterium CG08_land_8_20_14_0_20_52_24]PIV84771.1 MAG: metal ABC transporter permease [Nitrospirae bacterium CG17_big_fil_post_rev_8_21_14_2_50_50_9]PIW84830.1 MAG: metal ABC transporter permease [Nitrospirae bacterium CG_4_8_14_3_um_filter_50_41]PIX84871.1 MAG: metal ABC transporter permease [Nitrospirae bacterium CG_4_10_14_3_um_filter_53_41]PJA77535.1 MAG: metal ABC transporter permease [Nitrospirae bacterium CG_4_9_14_3_um_filter_53_35]
MQKALAAGILVSITCSVISFFVLVNRLSFIGVGISHAAFGGVAIGILFGIDPTLSAVIFSVLTAWMIGIVSRRGRLNEDTTIGIFYAAAMALGIVIIGLSRGYTVDLFGYLFGNILAVTSTDLWIVAALSLFVLGTVFYFFKELLYISFDEESAQVNGVPVAFLYYYLLTLMAVTIVISMKVVGIILVSALLVIPAAAAYEVSSHYKSVLIVSVIVGLVSALGGLLVSYRFNTASGATIVLLAAAVFLLLFTIRSLRTGPKKDRVPVHGPSDPQG